MIKNLGTKFLALLLFAVVAMVASPITAQEASPLPLAAPGEYTVGISFMSLVDTSRSGRKLNVAVWYPAIQPEQPDKKQPALPPDEWGWLNAAPNLQSTPYPLILYSDGETGSYADLHALDVLLASHGYVVVGLTTPDDEAQTTLVDRPFDMVFVLNQLAALTTGQLAGVIDTNHVGVMGWDDGAYAALALAGARVDPTSASAWGSKPMVPGDVTDPRDWRNDWNWDKLAAYRASLSPLTGAGLWPSFSDPRIKAALMFATCNTPMFGDAGLAAATVPSLFVGGTSDEYCPYEHDTNYDYTHLGSPDRYLLSVIKTDHYLPPDARYLGVFAQFAGAFFGDYVEGQQDDAQYLTAQYADSVEAQLKLGLVWGTYQGQ